jgi:hypothetical protein
MLPATRIGRVEAMGNEGIWNEGIWNEREA